MMKARHTTSRRWPIMRACVLAMMAAAGTAARVAAETAEPYAVMLEGLRMEIAAALPPRHFRGEKDPHFIYTLPAQSLAPGITKPSDIQGASTAFEIGAWHVPQKKADPNNHPYAAGLVEAILKTAY